MCVLQAFTLESVFISKQLCPDPQVAWKLNSGWYYLKCYIHLIPKAWSEHGVEALWTGQRNILYASTPCSLQAFGIRCIPCIIIILLYVNIITIVIIVIVIILTIIYSYNYNIVIGFIFVIIIIIVIIIAKLYNLSKRLRVWFVENVWFFKYFFLSKVQSFI